MRILQNGEHEPLKLAVHAALFGLSLLCLGYNAAAWCVRRQKHLATNAVIYTALSGLEWKQIQRHARGLRVDHQTSRPALRDLDAGVGETREATEPPTEVVPLSRRVA